MTKGKSRIFSLKSVEERDNWMEQIRHALSSSRSYGFVYIFWLMKSLDTLIRESRISYVSKKVFDPKTLKVSILSLLFAFWIVTKFFALTETCDSRIYHPTSRASERITRCPPCFQWPLTRRKSLPSTSSSLFEWFFVSFSLISLVLILFIAVVCGLCAIASEYEEEELSYSLVSFFLENGFLNVFLKRRINFWISY